MADLQQDLFAEASTDDLLRTMLAEAAKTSSELKCARRDVDKAESRMSFILMILNHMIKQTKGD